MSATPDRATVTESFSTSVMASAPCSLAWPC